jgi:hypothetical protein
MSIYQAQYNYTVSIPDTLGKFRVLAQCADRLGWRVGRRAFDVCIPMFSMITFTVTASVPEIAPKGDSAGPRSCNQAAFSLKFVCA